MGIGDVVINVLLFLSIIVNLFSYYTYNRIGEAIKAEDKKIESLRAKLVVIKVELSRLSGPECLCNGAKQCGYLSATNLLDA